MPLTTTKLVTRNSSGDEIGNVNFLYDNIADVLGNKKKNKQVGTLSQAIRAAACLSLGQNITAKSVHLTSRGMPGGIHYVTSLYHVSLTSTNNHLSVLRHYLCT